MLPEPTPLDGGNNNQHRMYLTAINIQFQCVTSSDQLTSHRYQTRNPPSQTWLQIGCQRYKPTDRNPSRSLSHVCRIIIIMFAEANEVANACAKPGVNSRMSHLSGPRRTHDTTLHVAATSALARICDTTCRSRRNSRSNRTCDELRCNCACVLITDARI